HGVLGFALPAAVVLASYPVLLRRLGGAAFGVYLLAASLSGASTFLDLGFSAATLKFVAADLAAGRLRAAANVIVTSLLCYSVIGITGGLVVMALAPWLTT